MGALDQDVHAICAYGADEECGEKPKEESGALEGVRHRENAGSQTTFEEVNEGVQVGSRMRKLPVLERVVKSGFLIVWPLHKGQCRSISERNGHFIFLALVSANPKVLARALRTLSRLTLTSVILHYHVS